MHNIGAQKGPFLLTAACFREPPVSTIYLVRATLTRGGASTGEVVHDRFNSSLAHNMEPPLIR